MLNNLNKIRWLLYIVFLICYGDALTSKETPPFRILLGNISFIFDVL